jgi:hypothetical protein
MFPAQGGLDQGMQQAMLSAGSDPRKLKQGYEDSVKKGSPDLAMLLGMQKLKGQGTNGSADKNLMQAKIAQEAQNMQAQMDQKPQTVMQQLEESLMGKPQQEQMASLGSGVAQAGAKSEQEEMMKKLMGKGGGRPPAPPMRGIPQAAQGGLIAGGGIASYAGPDGSFVESPIFSQKENQAPQFMQDKWAKSGVEGKIRQMLSTMPPETVELMVQGDPEASAVLRKLTDGEYGGVPAAQAQGQAPDKLAKPFEQMIDSLKTDMMQPPVQGPTTPAPPQPVAPPPASIAAASQNPTPAGPMPTVDAMAGQVKSQMPPMPTPSAAMPTPSAAPMPKPPAESMSVPSPASGIDLGLGQLLKSKEGTPQPPRPQPRPVATTSNGPSGPASTAPASVPQAAPSINTSDLSKLLGPKPSVQAPPQPQATASERGARVGIGEALKRAPGAASRAMPGAGKGIASIGDALPSVRVGGKPIGDAIMEGHNPLPPLLEKLGDKGTWKDNNPLPPGSTQPTSQQPTGIAAAPGGVKGGPPYRSLGHDQNPAVAGYDDELKNGTFFKPKEGIAQAAGEGLGEYKGAGAGTPVPGLTDLSPEGKRFQKIALDLASANPIDEETRRRDQYGQDNAGLRALQAEQKQGRSDYKALTNRLNDPDKLRDQRIAAFLSGGGGSNSNSAAGHGASHYNARNAQEKQLLSTEEQLRKLLNQEVETTTDYNTRLGNTGAKGYEAVSTARNTGLTSGSQLEMSQISARVREKAALVQADFNDAYKQNMATRQNRELMQSLIESREETGAAIGMALEMYPEGDLKTAYEEAIEEWNKDIREKNKRQIIEDEKEIGLLKRKMLPDMYQSLDSYDAMLQGIQGSANQQLPGAQPQGMPSGFKPGSSRAE